MNNVITKIQLVGDVVGYLDVDKNVPAPINFSISDIRDISKRNGVFSKTITLPGTKNNNELMNFYFDLNVSDGNSSQGQLNINKIQKCILLQDNIPLHENELYLQLINVNKVQNNITEDDEISYDVVVRDDVGEFFIRISNKLLTDLDFSEFDHNLNVSNVLNSFNHTWVDGYKYILPYKDDSRLWKFDDFRVCLYVKQYWDKIHAAAGFSYEWFNNKEPDYFDRLVIPYTNNFNKSIERLAFENEVIASSGPVQINHGAQFSGGLYTLGEPGVSRNFNNYAIPFNTVDKDVSNSFTAPFSWQPQIATDNFNFKIKISFTYRYQAVSGVVPAVININDAARIFKVRARPYIENVTIPIPQQSRINFPSFDTTLQRRFSCNNPGIGDCTYTITPVDWPENSLSYYEGEITIPKTNIGDDWRFYIDFAYFVEIDGFTPGFVDSTNIFASNFLRDEIRLVITLDSNKLIPPQRMFVDDFIPEEIKQSDFMKSLYTMYNIYVVESKTDPNKLIYYTRDDYYRSGKNLDWTLKMARDNEQKIDFLPELISKELILTYKDDDDPANEFYQNFKRKTYGQLTRQFNNEYVKGVDKKELIFSPTPAGKTGYFHYLPYLYEDSNIRILIDNGTLLSTPSMVLLTGYVSITFIPILVPFSNYPFISHINKRTNPNFDLNFDRAEYYFYDIGSETYNNLGNLYWLNTINQLDKGRMLTAYFYLSAADIQELELNDTIRIDNSYWNINKIIDYNAADRSLTKVELISYNELLPLPIIPDFEEIEVEEPEPEEPEEPEEE